MKNTPYPLHNKDGKLLRQASIQAEAKWMKVNIMNSERLRATDSMVEEVDRRTFLGKQVTKDRGATLDIKKRIALAYAIFNKFNKIWRARNISRKTKAMLLKKLVLSVLLYVCET